MPGMVFILGEERMRPWMREGEIRALESELLGRARESGRVDVLEWGSGGSTVYFTDFLRTHKVPYSWLSVEYNRLWYEKIKERVAEDSQTEIVLFDAGNNAVKQRHTNMDEYVAYPGTLGKQFHLILVDGRKRRRCILVAKKLLARYGSVFLHDAERLYYHDAFFGYADSRYVRPHLWCGRNDSPRFARRIRNAINIFVFTRLHRVVLTLKQYYFRLFKVFRSLRGK